MRVTAAPPLPPDTTSVNRVHGVTLQEFSLSDQVLSCDALAQEQKDNSDALAANNATIAGDRTQNEVAAYMSDTILMPVAIFALKPDSSQRYAVTRLYARQDTLASLARVKSCSDRTTQSIKEERRDLMP